MQQVTEVILNSNQYSLLQCQKKTVLTKKDVMQRGYEQNMTYKKSLTVDVDSLKKVLRSYSKTKMTIYDIKLLRQLGLQEYVKEVFEIKRQKMKHRQRKILKKRSDSAREIYKVPSEAASPVNYEELSTNKKEFESTLKSLATDPSEVQLLSKKKRSNEQIEHEIYFKDDRDSFEEEEKRVMGTESWQAPEMTWQSPIIMQNIKKKGSRIVEYLMGYEGASSKQLKVTDHNTFSKKDADSFQKH